MIEQRIESQKVKSLILEAVDGGPVIDYQPGQYIGIEVQPKYHEFKEIRQYSLSDKANGQRYRISVKRETDGAPGVVSHYLHNDLHACENSEQHSFKKRLAELVQQQKVNALTWYKSEAILQSGTHHGYMDIAAVEQPLPLALADFYLCGPVSFMQFAKQQLITLGVNNERIHYEVFGPHEKL